MGTMLARAAASPRAARERLFYGAMAFAIAATVFVGWQSQEHQKFSDAIHGIDGFTRRDLVGRTPFARDRSANS